MFSWFKHSKKTENSNSLASQSTSNQAVVVDQQASQAREDVAAKPTIFSRRRTKISPSPKSAVKRAVDQQETQVTDHAVAKEIALSTLKLTLKTFGRASENIPVPGVRLVVETLLETIDKIQVCCRTFDQLPSHADKYLEI